MDYAKDYEISKWSEWLDELCDAARDFHLTFNKTPYLLEATEHTLSQFEYMTAYAPVGDEIMNMDSEKLGNQVEESKIHIRELTFKGEFTMTFVVNENLADKMFRLKSNLIKKKKGSIEINAETEREKEIEEEKIFANLTSVLL